MFAKNRNATLIMTLVLVMVLLVACSQTSAPPEEAVEVVVEDEDVEVVVEDEEPSMLRVWIAWGNNPEWLQSFFDRYGEAEGVEVEVNANVEADKILTGLSGSEPPDVLILGGPDDVGSWAREELVLPLDDVIAANDMNLDDIFSAPLGQCKFQDTYYCLPWGTDNYALFWNKDLFEDAGLDPESPPQTMEELVEYADELTKFDGDGNMVQAGFIPDFSWSHLDLYAAMFGGYWVSEDGTEIQMTSQPVIDALKWEQQFYTKYGPEEVLRLSSGLGDYMSPDHGFYAGKVAMMVEGEWQPGKNFIGLYKPELNYGVAPFPPPADHPERENTNVVGGTVVVIPSNVKDTGAAGKLLAWLMEPEIVADFFVENFNLPTSKEAAKDPRFAENEKFMVFVELMGDPNAMTIPHTLIDTDISTEMGMIEEQVLHAGADPEPLLQEAQEKLQPMLDEALGK
jgi:multiple sugar transport system substrate-binding protein